MKTILLVLCGLILAFPAHGELNLEKPNVLLEKAKTGRIACREVILDIQQNIPELREPALFESYFSVLDELEIIAQSLNLDDIYPDAVKNLGLQMVSSGIRWLSASRDSIEKILEYHRWMNSNVAYSFEANTELEAKTLTDPLAIRRFATNIDLLIPWIRKNFPNETGLLLGYQNLISDMAAKFLSNPNLTEEDRIFWLQKIYSTNGFSAALSGIQSEILTTTKENKFLLHQYIRRLLSLAQKIKSGENQPIWLMDQLGEIAGEAAIRMVDYRERFIVGEFSGLLDLLRAKHLKFFSAQWMMSDRVPNDEYAEDYLDLTRVLLQYLSQNNLEKESDDISRFLALYAASVMAKSKRLEGTYNLRDRHGKSWKFTAVLARESTLFVALEDADGFVRKSFYNVSYGIENDTFVASERELDTDPARNLTIKFKLIGDGKIEVRDLMALPGEQILKGKKSETYPNYFLQADPNPIDPSGTYQGMVHFGKNFSIKMNLVVTSFHGHTLGRMSDENQTMFLDLNVGTRGVDSVLYLTTGRRQRTNWVQLRGVVKNGTFRGFVINGGRGISAKEFILKKISN